MRYCACRYMQYVCLYSFQARSRNIRLSLRRTTRGYLDYKTSGYSENYDADSILMKDISFVFDMKAQIDMSSISYDFMIIRGGVIYKGPFKKNITVKNVPFIMDNNLTRINTISFALLDHTNKQVYTWFKKESYYLYKKDKYRITLKNNGEFSIR